MIHWLFYERFRWRSKTRGRNFIFLKCVRGIACRCDCIPNVSRLFWPLSGSSYFLCSFSYLSSSIPHWQCQRFYIFHGFFLFLFTLSRCRHTNLPAVYLRSADAYNGCTKVTEFISVQQTTPTRVGLRGRELQTIAGLRDNVIVFFFRGVRTNKRKERTMMSLHYCAVYDESSLK